MERIKTQTAETISERGIFLNNLRGGPFRLSGRWPSSHTVEGRKARTDIAIALVKNGLLTYKHGIFKVADRPIQLGPDLKKPGREIRLTWLDDNRLEKELA